MHEGPVIVWFRQDLRVSDQPALHYALQNSKNVVAVFVWSPEEEGSWSLGAASRWWLHHSLVSLKQDLSDLNIQLVLRIGNSLQELSSIAKEVKAQEIVWNRRYEPIVMKRDGSIQAELQDQGFKTKVFEGLLLFEPWKILTKQNKPYQVFTPFWKTCLQQSEPLKPLPMPLPAKNKLLLATKSLNELKLLPTIGWDEGFVKEWKPGEKGALIHLKQAILHAVKDYGENRNYPAIDGTSKLSPYLCSGNISPRVIWHEIKQTFDDDEMIKPFLTQLGWREFAYHLLYHFPQTPDYPLREQYAAFPWINQPTQLTAWQKGMTGYPIVDAGMRQLWHTGWMHNRVRMIVGSFLVKDLLISWHKGAKWFWDTLVDADLANNTLGWQWVGGCGADAAPYFRIFNPTLQGKKFDPNGDYVRKWVPELAGLPNEWIHEPSAAPEMLLRSYGFNLGTDYPRPIVNHDIARKAALEALSSI